MIVKSKMNDNYVGPRAIFDPHYIPPQLLHRKKEEHSLSSILNDSISDEFCLNILYQGIQGIGKKVIINKVIKDLKIQEKNLTSIQTINVDCKEKNLEELIFSLLDGINNISNLNINLNSIINSKISHLWSIVKLSCKKINNPILILSNTEHLKHEILKKFLQFGKSTNITIISTVNRVLRAATLDVLSEFDFKKKMKYFNYNELLDILKQRASLTFLHEIDQDLIEIITDLIFEHYVPVPGKGIDVFRDIYPFLKEQKTIEQTELLEVCQTNFDSFQLSDDFSMLSYISEEDILTIIFLDNLSNHFLNQSRYYITSKEIKELFDVSCESLGYVKNIGELKDLIKKLSNLGIISASKKDISDLNKLNKRNPLKNQYYFMVINPNQLKAMIDVIFKSF